MTAATETHTVYRTTEATRTKRLAPGVTVVKWITTTK